MSVPDLISKIIRNKTSEYIKRSELQPLIDILNSPDDSISKSLSEDCWYYMKLEIESNHKSKKYSFIYLYRILSLLNFLIFTNKHYRTLVHTNLNYLINFFIKKKNKTSKNKDVIQNNNRIKNYFLSLLYIWQDHFQYTLVQFNLVYRYLKEKKKIIFPNNFMEEIEKNEIFPFMNNSDHLLENKKLSIKQSLNLILETEKIIKSNDFSRDIFKLKDFKQQLEECFIMLFPPLDSDYNEPHEKKIEHIENNNDCFGDIDWEIAEEDKDNKINEFKIINEENESEIDSNSDSDNENEEVNLDEIPGFKNTIKINLSINFKEIVNEDNEIIIEQIKDLLKQSTKLLIKYKELLVNNLRPSINLLQNRKDYLVNAIEEMEKNNDNKSQFEDLNNFNIEIEYDTNYFSLLNDSSKDENDKIKKSKILDFYEIYSLNQREIKLSTRLKELKEAEKLVFEAINELKDIITNKCKSLLTT